MQNSIIIEKEGLEYDIFQDHAEVVKCGAVGAHHTVYYNNQQRQTAKCIDIPSYIEYKDKLYPVETIRESAFDNLIDVEVIKLPKTIKDCKWGFWKCHKLKRIEVSKDNTSICDIKGVLFTKDKKQLLAFPPSYSESYEVPSGTECICHFAFKACSCLKSIILPQSLRAIGNNAFYRCYSLDKIELPDNMLYFGGISDYSGSLLKTSVIFKGKEYNIHEMSGILTKKPQGYKFL